MQLQACDCHMTRSMLIENGATWKEEIEVLYYTINRGVIDDVICHMLEI